MGLTATISGSRSDAGLKLMTIILLGLSCSQGEVVTVNRVVDGDTIEITSATGRKARVRLVGIDAAEPRRDARAKGQAKEHGIDLAAVVAASKKATAALVKLVEGKRVKLVEACKLAMVDKYGRRLCYVEVSGKDVGEELLRAGLVWRYEKFKHPRLERYRKVKIEP